MESLSPESSWVLIFGASVSPANALPPHRGTVRSQRRLKVVKFQMPGTRDTPRGHNQGREELSKGLQNFLSQDSETNKPSGRSYNSPACHPPPQKTPNKEGLILFGLFRFARICQRALPSASLPQTPSTVPPSHAATRSIPGPSRKDTLQGRERKGQQGRRVTREGAGTSVLGDTGPCWGTQHGSASVTDN